MGRCGDRLAPDGSTYFEPGCIGGAESVLLSPRAMRCATNLKKFLRSVRAVIRGEAGTRQAGDRARALRQHRAC